MKLGIMQPYFLPYIGYWQLMNIVDKYVIYDDVNYIKAGYISRNKLLLNGKEFMFNLILSGASQNKLICEIIVADNQSKLIKTIERAYKKSPCFNNIFPIIKSIIEFENKNLARFIGNSIIQIASCLGLKTEFIYSSEIKKDCSLRGQEKILNICNILLATEYINAIGGMELYSKEIFKEQKIELKFIKSKPIEYRQFNNEFVPLLSILDVMMFNSVEKINKMLDNFEVI